MSSTITEGLMTVGGFSYTFEHRGRRDRLDRVGQFDRLVVTAGRTWARDALDLYPVSIFTGLVQSKRSAGGLVTLEGLSNTALFGTPEGIGPSAPYAIDVGMDLLTALSATVPGGPSAGGLVEGTISGVSGVTDLGFQPAIGEVELDWLLSIAQRHNVEFRVNPDNSVDFAPPTQAAVWSQAPVAYLAPHLVGQDLVRPVLRAEVTGGRNWQDWASERLIESSVNTDAGLAVRTGDYGNWSKVDEIDGIEPFLGIQAQFDLDYVYTEKREVEAVVDVHDPTRYWRIGDLLGAWSPQDGVYDLAHQTRLLGDPAFPVWARLLGQTRPHRPEFGLWIVSALDYQDVTDLSEQVVVDPSDQVSVDLGFRHPTIGEVLSRTRRR